MNLALFFTRNVSLELWLNGGLFEREKVVYERLLDLKVFDEVTWYTYGCNDASIALKLISSGKLHKKIKVLQMPVFFKIPKVGCWIYSCLMPLVYHRNLSAADVYMTNQLDGGWAASIASKIFRKPMISRCGYIGTNMERKMSRLSFFKLKSMFMLEALVLRSSDYQLFSSDHDARYAIDKYKLNPEEVTVVRNWIDVELFRRQSNAECFDRLLFVGRFNDQKNLLNLIRALEGSGFALDLIGDGPLRASLMKAASVHNVDVSFLGKKANNELPHILQRYQFFVLPSLVEGMPKTLLEAMACELVCVGTNVCGINEVIKHDVDGFLSEGTDVRSLQDVLKTLHLLDADTRRRVATAARSKIAEFYSLESCLRMYAEVFRVSIMEKSP